MLETKFISFQTLGVIIFWIVTLLVILSPDIIILKGLADLAVHLMLGFLVFGFLFFIINKKRLFLHSFLCCMSLCLFLKSASNTNFRLPEEVASIPNLKVAHVNLSSVEGNYKSLLDCLIDKDPDVVSLQEVNPAWSRLLEKYFSELYPYQRKNVRIDPFGMAVLSKKSITALDTVAFREYPSLCATIHVDSMLDIKLTNTLMLPSIDRKMDSVQSQQMEYLTDFVRRDSAHQLVLGDFNMVYWSSKIRDFRGATGLKNSRRDLSQSVLSIPYDHIFYGESMECTAFSDLVDSLGTRLGIIGTYQIHNNM